MIFKTRKRKQKYEPYMITKVIRKKKIGNFEFVLECNYMLYSYSERWYKLLIKNDIRLLESSGIWNDEKEAINDFEKIIKQWER